jgi:predicted  nucleic acid-binding Zn-ribbon protein
VVMERTNKVKMISKNDEHSKTPKGMPEWFWMWSENVYNRDISKINDRIDGLEHRIDHLENRINEVEKNLTTRLDKHDEIFKRNNLS